MLPLILPSLTRLLVRRDDVPVKSVRPTASERQ